MSHVMPQPMQQADVQLTQMPSPLELATQSSLPTVVIAPSATRPRGPGRRCLPWASFQVPRPCYLKTDRLLTAVRTDPASV
jgi:hypothetical protein